MEPELEHPIVFWLHVFFITSFQVSNIRWVSNETNANETNRTFTKEDRKCSDAWTNVEGVWMFKLEMSPQQQWKVI